MRPSVSALVILFITLTTLTSHGEIPQVMNYQGKVTDTGGTPVADGDYTMTFTIYDAATSGTSLWSSGAVTVTVSGGIFSVLLGESPQPALTLDFDADCWLEIDIAGDIQSPRVRLGSVGYAYMASGIVPGTEMVDSRSNPIFKGTNLGSGAGLRGDSDQGIGVRGESAATDGKGIYGFANAATGTTYGVYGETNSADGFAGYFAGRARITGDLTVTSGGKVGIGVTSPGNPLVIAGAESDTAGTGAQVRIHDSGNSNHAFALRIGASGNQNLNLDSYWGGWQAVMTVDRETGQVGLGTDTPDRDLSVVGYVRASNDVDETEYVEMYHGGGNGFVNWNGDGNFEMRYANNAKVTLQQDGSVGIGTTNPGATLDVRGSAVFNEDGGNYDFRVESDSRVNMLLVDASTDRVGIGTATPNAVLDVRGDAVFNEAGNDYDFRVEGDTKPNLLLVDASTDRVGVGTATPNAVLDVRGDAVFNEAGNDHDFRVEGDTEPNLLLVDASTDRVGVGTPTPGAALDVHGGTNTIAVRGETGANWGWGVYGYATATGATEYNYGVVGRNDSPMGAGVYGKTYTTDGPATGGYFESGSIIGSGAYGYSTATTGETSGVTGRCDSPSGTGVRGYAHATTGTATGVRGRTQSATGYGVYSEGNFACSGTKSCVVKTSRGPTLTYCQESPENWFEDFGEGQLVNGRCHIDLDPLFLETVTVDEVNPMKVFVELGDDCNGVFVRRGVTGFEVVELRNGTASVPFCYRVVAKRKGFESKRLDYCKAAETDSNLYPELRWRAPFIED